MLQLIPPIKHLSELAGPITRGLAAVDKGVGLIDGSRPERGGSFDPGRSAGRIELRGVTLRYRAAQAPALDRIDLELRAGETVALVGPSGAGKTTLVNLLPRFLEPTSGTLLLDGHALADWNVAALQAPVRARQPGRRPLQRHGRRQRLARQRRRRRRATASGSAPRWRAPTCSSSPSRCRTGSTPSSATTPASSRAASASAWRSPARSTRTRRS